MKIHILFKFKNEPTGGGNQFLKSLKKYLQSTNTYEEDVKKTEVVLFNSHHSADEVAGIKLKYPQKFFVHRIDGPMRLYNRPTDKRDNIVYLTDKYLAHATVFQSEWSKQQNHQLGLPPNLFETVIHNAPDPLIFNRNEKIPFSAERKTRLVAISWSKNWNKGFQTYQWLDQNLDFDNYEMTFIGNCPFEFKNITHIPPLNNNEIAEKLKENDIFIFASPIEACSNSLLEALHCGLPAVTAATGSNPELLGKGGETFIKPDQIPSLLEKIVQNYSTYQTNINNPLIDEVGEKYYDFIADSYNNFQQHRQKAESFRWIDYIKLRASIMQCRLSNKLMQITKSAQ